MSRRVVATASGIVLLAACARIAGLADSDKLGNAPTKGEPFPENDAGAVISPQKLIVEAGCGTMNASDYVSIENHGKEEIAYEVTSPNPEVIGLVDDPDGGGVVDGKVEAGSLKLVYVRVVGSTPGSRDAKIYVKTDSVIQPIPVTVSVDGAALVFPKPVIDFGQVRQLTDIPAQQVDIQNTGNQPAAITGWTSDPATQDFTLTDLPTIAAGEKASVSARFAKGPAGDPLSAVFTPAGAGLCGSSTVKLQGQRVSQDVTVNPTELTFSQFTSGNMQCVGCGTAVGAGLPLTLSNFSPNAVATVTVQPPTQFTVSPTTQTVQVATGTTPGQATVVVTPKGYGNTPGPVSENISLTITAPGADTRTATVKAQYTVCGGVLSFSAASLSFNSQGQCRQLTIANFGNVPISFALAGSGDMGAFQVIGYPSSLGPGERSETVPFLCVESEVAFEGTMSGKLYQATLTAGPQSGSFLCGPPPTVTLNCQF